MLNVDVVFVVGVGGGDDDDDDVGRELFFFDVHLSVTCECKSCSNGGACFCVFFFFLSFCSIKCIVCQSLGGGEKETAGVGGH